MAFPTTKSDKVDNVDDVMAGDINAIEDKLGNGAANNEPAINKILRGTGAGTSEWRNDIGNIAYDYTIYSDDDYIYAVNRNGELVAGGSGNLNVTDSTDFAEIFAYCVNTTPYCSIKLSPASLHHSNLKYIIKSNQKLTNVFSLFGAGRNRSNIYAGTEMEGLTCFNLEPTAAKYIFEIYNVKFMAEDGDIKPAYFFVGDNETDYVTELNLAFCEFRDCSTHAIKIISDIGWNSVVECWFLINSGFYFDGFADLRLIGNIIRGNSTLKNIDKFAQAGNYVADGVTITKESVVSTGEGTGVRAYLSANQENLVDQAYTKVLLNAENYDVSADFDTANSRFVAPVTGYYQVNALVSWVSSSVIADKTYMSLIYVNGAEYSRAYNHSSLASILGCPISDVVYAQAGQYIELYARHVAGANTPDVLGGSNYTYMSVHKLPT